MSENLSFPTTYKELTVEWLNKILEKELKTKIISFNEGEKVDPGFTGEVFRIIPKYEKENNKNLPKSFIIKSQTSHSGINSFLTKIQGYSKEIQIYYLLSKIENLNVAKIYYSEINKECSKYIMIMQDLKQLGFKCHDSEIPFDIKTFKLIIDYFAKFQSFFWGQNNNKNLTFLKQNSFADYIKEVTIKRFDSKKENFCNNNKNILNQETINLIKSIKINELFELIDPDNIKNINNNTLLHGDPQAGNLLINEKKDDIYMIDWQYISVGLGLKDIILFIGISLDENKITKEEILELKKFYYDSLLKYGVKNYTKEKFDEDWNNLKLISLCNIIAASTDENIGDDEEKKKKYGKHIFLAERRFIHFVQNQ